MLPRSLLCAALLGATFAPDSHARSLGSLDFTPCTLAPEVGLASVEAQCGTLSVPEDRSAPEGRRIDLAIAWIPTEADAEPDPVFMLAGGPGQAAREAYPSTAAAFRDVRRTRHVILVDQRGTGGSNPMKCLDAQGRSAFTDPDDPGIEAAARFARSCLEQLAPRADPRFYTTTDAVHDLEAVRAAIGAERINLVGISYGTRVAQQYLRHYPERVRSAVLDGVVPNALVLGSEHARNLESALDLHFAQCSASPACTARIGAPRESLTKLRTELIAAPRRVEYRDALSGEVTSKLLTWGHVAGVTRMFAYAPQSAALLPLTLHEAAQGRAAPLMAQAEMILGQIGEQIMHGMQLSVMCSEDGDSLVPDPADAQTVLGSEFVEFSQAQCAVWPRGERPPDFHAPLASDAPILLLSGEYDPVTPPRYGDAVLRRLADVNAPGSSQGELAAGRHLVLPGQGHNVIGVGCMPKLMARFIDSADARTLEADCLEQLAATPAFAGFYGWEP